MPHLSPMNWILAMTVTWYVLSISSCSHWWFHSMKFIPMHQDKKTTSFKNWSWL